MTREIVIRIQIPDDMNPDVDYADMPEEPPFLMDVPPPVAEAPRPVTFASTTPMCPDGHGPMKYVPPGVSKRTNKPYDGFYGCNDRACKRTEKAA